MNLTGARGWRYHEISIATISVFVPWDLAALQQVVFARIIWIEPNIDQVGSIRIDFAIKAQMQLNAFSSWTRNRFFIRGVCHGTQHGQHEAQPERLHRTTFFLHSSSRLFLFLITTTESRETLSLSTTGDDC